MIIVTVIFIVVKTDGAVGVAIFFRNGIAQ
jgi:hypothetical protein